MRKAKAVCSKHLVAGESATITCVWPRLVGRQGSWKASYRRKGDIYGGPNERLLA